MFEEVVYLPYSGRRYQVSQYGEIFQGKRMLVSRVKDGHTYINLEWVMGKRPYLAAVAVLVAFSQLKLPEHLYDEVEPLYVDGDCTNLAPSNLLYKFRNGPLEVENFPGFYYIPFYTTYAINEHGVLVNVETGKEKSWSLTPTNGPKGQTGGYSYSRVVTDNGFSKTLFLHRALCLVFKPYGADVGKKVVNHLDGKPSNNLLINLEWTSYRENNIHAIENNLKPRNNLRPVPVLMWNLKSNEIQKFPTIQACARFLNNPRGDFIRHRLENCPTRIFADMLLFKYDDGKPWPEIDLDDVEICRVGHGSDIAARNVFTGHIVVFTGSESGFAFTGVKGATILRHLRESSSIPVNGWNFRYLEDAKEWPEHSARHLQIYKKFPIYPPDGAIATDIASGEQKFFTSTAEAAKAFHLSKSGFWNFVKSGKLVQDKYKLTIFKLRENLGLPTE